MHKSGPQKRRIFQFVFEPLEYAEGYDTPALREELMRAGCAFGFFPGQFAQRRRDGWAITLPLGTFVHDFTPGAVTPQQDLAKRVATMDRMKKHSGKMGFTERDIFQYQGHWFYRVPALKAFYELANAKYIFQAAFRFIEAASKDPTLLKGDPRRVVPIADRPIVNGKRARGPAWTPAEDQVLRDYFGRRNCYSPDCKHCWDKQKKEPNYRKVRHHKMDPAWWPTLLDNKLRGIRTRASVQLRLTFLNNQLKRNLMRDGKLPREYEGEYRKNFLGESLRMPRKLKIVGERKIRPSADLSLPA